jgi:hypothetical protein
MRNKKLVVGAVVLSMLALAGLQATAGKAMAYTLAESVVYPEGIGIDGLPVTANTAAFPYSFVGPAMNVQADWSDDIIFHQFPVGQKVRTEVVLHDLTIGAAVYTMSAHFMIEVLDANRMPTGVVLYESYIAEGLWLDGPTTAYSAEVNELGNLLYGYNWETRGLKAGWYRLTFWIENEQPVNPAAPIIQFTDVDLTSGAPGDTDPSAGEMFGFVGYDLAGDKTWLDINLIQKTSGRK